MRQLTFSIIFGLFLVSGKTSYSDSTEKIINVRCATCHGSQGISKGAGVPHLAGQPESYLKEQLENTRGETTPNYVNYCGQLSNDEITTLASWYSKIKIQIVESV